MHRHTRWFAIVVLPALAGLIVAAVVVHSGAWTRIRAFRFPVQARVDAPVRATTATVTVVGDHVELQPGPAFTEKELRWLGDEIKSRYPSTAFYPGIDGRIPIWKYSCEVEWIRGTMRLTRATPLHGL